jgi:hypothetical protein
VVPVMQYTRLIREHWLPNSRSTSEPIKTIDNIFKKTIGDPDEIFSSCLQTSKECGLVQCHGQYRNVAQSKGLVAPLMRNAGPIQDNRQDF